MNTMSIKLHTTEKEPEDIVPFAMVPQSVWRAYEMGTLNGERVLLFAVLYCHVNPYRGTGIASYEKICGWLQLKQTKQNINHVNKLMVELRDKHRLIWYPTHSGSRGFEYVIAKFKLAKLPENKEKQPDRWIDINPYFQDKEQSESRGTNGALPKPSSEPMPRHPPPEQRFERSNGDGFISAGEALEKRFGRPSQTNTDKQT